MRRAIGTVGALVVVAALVAGCSQAPSYSEVKSETESAMQQVIDALPAGTEVEDLSQDPYACDLGSGNLFQGEGEFFTGHWVAHPPGDFDGEAFVADLPAGLGEAWTVDDEAIGMSVPSVEISNGDVSLTVAAAEDEDGQGTFVDILGLSRCGAVQN